jgi:uncharacterized membrane protein YdjX (TVP38/TMEM64 family)
MTDPDATATAASPACHFITRARRLGAAGPLSLLTFVLPPVGSFILLGSVSRLAPWLRAHPGEGLVVYLVGATVLAALAFLPTFACAIVGGWTLGFGIGFTASLAAFCAAAMLAYEINRRAAGDRVDGLVRQRPKWEAIRVALLNSGFGRAVWIITLLRLPPLSPFAPFNFLLGATKTRRGAYFLGTMIGMAPRTAVAAWAASRASQLDFQNRGQTWTFFAGLAAALLSIAIVGHLANQAVRRATVAREPNLSRGSS